MHSRFRLSAPRVSAVLRVRPGTTGVISPVGPISKCATVDWWSKRREKREEEKRREKVRSAEESEKKDERREEHKTTIRVCNLAALTTEKSGSRR